MKQTEITGLYLAYDLPSPEAYKAQRMAELEQMAAYRKLKLKQYQDWADPVKRAAFQAQVKAEEDQARFLLGEMFKDSDPNFSYAKIAVRPLTEEAQLVFKIAPLQVLPKIPRLTRTQRIKRWLKTYAIFWKK